MATGESHELYLVSKLIYRILPTVVRKTSGSCWEDYCVTFTFTFVHPKVLYVHVASDSSYLHTCCLRFSKNTKLSAMAIACYLLGCWGAIFGKIRGRRFLWPLRQSDLAMRMDLMLAFCLAAIWHETGLHVLMGDAAWSNGVQWILLLTRN